MDFDTAAYMHAGVELLALSFEYVVNICVRKISCIVLGMELQSNT